MFAGVLLALACSGPSNLGSGGGGGSDGSTELDVVIAHGSVDGGVACSDFAADKCAKFDACTQGIYNEVHYGALAECVSRETTACLGILAAPDNTATPAGFRQCGLDIMAGTCANFFDVTNTTPACTPQVGSRANGRGCVNDGQCTSTWCYARTGAVCGVCATRPPSGAPCVASVDCGGRGTLCSTAGTCAAVVTEGGSCDASHPCGFALSCVGSTATTSGTCESAGAAVGATCDGKRAKAPLCELDFGFYCPPATDKCAKVTLAMAGQMCGVIASTSDGGALPPLAICSGGSACEPGPGTTSVCVAAAADGAKCDTATGPPCLDPARCVSKVDASVSGTCAILDTTTCD